MFIPAHGQNQFQRCAKILEVLPLRAGLGLTAAHKAGRDRLGLARRAIAQYLAQTGERLPQTTTEAVDRFRALQSARCYQARLYKESFAGALYHDRLE